MTTLSELYRCHEGKVSDKWEHYLDAYDRHLGGYRDRPVNLLEIGIQNGGSLEIWSRFFKNFNLIVGCDINPECARLSYEDSRIRTVIADANSDRAESEIASFSEHFDIVIDDGSHQSDDIIKTFARYFPYVKDDGIFIVEDLHCSYWQNFKGGCHHPYSSMAFFKRLADIVNFDHWGSGVSRAGFLEGFAKQYGTSFDEEVLSQVYSVEFSNSLCVVKKRAAGSSLGRRVVAGRREIVASGHIELMDTPCPVMDQTGSLWSAATPTIEERCFAALDTVRDREEEIAVLLRTAAERDEELARRDRLMEEQGVRIASLDQALSEHEERIAGLAQGIKEREGQISELMQKLSESERRIAELAQEVAEREERIAGLCRSVAERDGQIVALTRLVEQMNSALDALHQSTSWKITAPLRSVGGALRGLVK